MNIEEIQQTLETVVKSQANHEARAAKMEAAFQSVAQSLQLLIEMTATHEERLDGHDEAQTHPDARLDALIDAQVRYEARQEHLEEAFRQVAVSHQTLIQLIRIQEERIDGHDQVQQSTDDRLDSLIDVQIGLDERIARLATAQVDHRRQAEERHARLAEKLSHLAAAQARSDERINELFNKKL